MGVFPSFPKPASATVTSYSPTVVSLTHGLKRQLPLFGPSLLEALEAPLHLFQTCAQACLQGFVD